MPTIFPLILSCVKDNVLKSCKNLSYFHQHECYIRSNYEKSLNNLPYFHRINVCVMDIYPLLKLPEQNYNLAFCLYKRKKNKTHVL